MNCRMDNTIYFNDSQPISEKLSCLEMKQALVISMLQSNISDSLKDGLRYELELILKATDSFKSKQAN